MRLIKVSVTAIRVGDEDKFTGEIVFSNKEGGNDIKINYLCNKPNEIEQNIDFLFKEDGCEEFNLKGKTKEEPFVSLNTRQRLLYLIPFNLILISIGRVNMYFNENFQTVESEVEIQGESNDSFKMNQEAFDLIFKKECTL